MLSEDPRLAYVALTRAKETMYPRVQKKNLISDMRYSKNYYGFVDIYEKMFPIGI